MFVGVQIACHNDGNDRCWNWTARPNFHKHSESRPFIITGSARAELVVSKARAIKNRHAHGGWFQDVDVLHIKPAVPVGPLFHQFASLRAKPSCIEKGKTKPTEMGSGIHQWISHLWRVRGSDRNTYAETSPPPVHFLHVASTRFCSMAFLWMMGYQRSVLPDQAP